MSVAAIQPLPRMPAWTDKAISAFSFREALFIRRGLDEQSAEALADRLAFRDYEWDQRHACVECESFQASRGTCFKRLTVSKTQLVNCHGFSFTKP